MKRTIIILLSICWLSSTTQSQTITFTLPEDANREFIFTVPNGLKSDTIAKGRISMTGKGEITLPERYHSTPALGGLTIFGSNKKPIYLIVEDRNFSFQIKDKEIFIFDNSIENELFYNKRADIMNPENEKTFAQFIIKTNSILG